jgi:hypothetical protein
MADDLVDLEGFGRFGGEQRSVHDAARKQLIRIRRRLERDVHAQRLGNLVHHAAAHAEFQSSQVVHLGDRTLGVEHDAGTVGEEGQHLDPLVFGGELRVFGGDAAVRDGKGLRVLPRNGISAIWV